jgi:hypothetical protein
MKGYRHKWSKLSRTDSQCDNCGLVYPTIGIRRGGLGACRHPKETKV